MALDGFLRAPALAAPRCARALAAHCARPMTWPATLRVPETARRRSARTSAAARPARTLASASAPSGHTPSAPFIGTGVASSAVVATTLHTGSVAPSASPPHCSSDRQWLTLSAPTTAPCENTHVREKRPAHAARPDAAAAATSLLGVQHMQRGRSHRPILDRLVALEDGHERRAPWSAPATRASSDGAGWSDHAAVPPPNHCAGHGDFSGGCGRGLTAVDACECDEGYATLLRRVASSRGTARMPTRGRPAARLCFDGVRCASSPAPRCSPTLHRRARASARRPPTARPRVHLHINRQYVWAAGPAHDRYFAAYAASGCAWPGSCDANPLTTSRLVRRRPSPPSPGYAEVRGRCPTRRPPSPHDGARVPARLPAHHARRRQPRRVRASRAHPRRRRRRRRTSVESRVQVLCRRRAPRRRRRSLARTAVGARCEFATVGGPLGRRLLHRHAADAHYFCEPSPKFADRRRRSASSSTDQSGRTR